MNYLFQILICIISIGILPGCKQAQQVKQSETLSVEAEEPVFSSFEYEVREPTIKSDHPPLLLLLHGRGSNELDLLSFTEAFTKEMVVVSPRAPIELGKDRYSWYTLDRSTGELVYNAEELEWSCNDLIEFTTSMIDRYQANPEKVYVAGFSQGSILSLGLALRHPDIFKAGMCWSGQLYDEFKTNLTKFNPKEGPKLFVSHGNNDNVLPAKHVKADVEYLKSLGYQVTERYYDSGHTISQENYNDIVQWVKAEL